MKALYGNVFIYMPKNSNASTSEEREAQPTIAKKKRFELVVHWLKFRL